MPAAVGFHCPQCVQQANAHRRETTTVLGGRPVATTTLTYILVGAALLVTLTGYTPMRQAVLPLLAFNPDAVLTRPWTVLTYGIAGGGGFLPLLSLLALYLLGRECEQLLGTARFAALWVAVTLGGALAVWLIGLVLGPDGLPGLSGLCWTGG
ncbi:MAG: hypothetical protein ACK5MT_22505, partial [Actinomycetales bacterium]